MSTKTRAEEIEAAAKKYVEEGLAKSDHPHEFYSFVDGMKQADAHPSPEVLALVEALSAQGCSDEVYAERARTALSNFNKARGGVKP